MEGERERLERMYGEMGDERLRDLAGDRESLTVDGQMALAKVLAARGMTAPAASVPMQPVVTSVGLERESGFTPGFPGVVPSGAGAMEMALEPGGESRDGMARLISFFDGYELSKACAALEDAGLDFALEEQDRDALSGAPSSTTVWVGEGEVAAAQAVLRQAVGLFPEAEVDGEAAVLYGDEPIVLGSFETAAEAARVTGLLQAAGIASTANTDEDGVHTVEVKGTDLERGLAVVAAGMGIRQ